jgi:hypothetical protein
MWNYYGSKSIIVDLYPPPKYGKIIEPFAGSARYSLKYWDRDVLLVDKYEVVIKVWKWLQQCSKNDVIGLPDLKKGELISDYNLCEGAAMFLGFLAGVSCTSPRNKMSMFAAEQNGKKNKLKRIADNLDKIKHWEIRHGSYDDIENQNATWFIDPPYQFGGHAYVENVIDFKLLATWIKTRHGHIIACENTKADWMNFKPMVRMRGGNTEYTTEAIWSNLPTNFDQQQQSLF